jgi:hypothetical protein
MNIKEARASAIFAHVEKSSGSVYYKVHLPGHNGRRYLVLIRKENHDTFTVLTGECLLDLDKLGSPISDCPSGNGVCYHMLASIIAIASMNHQTVQFTYKKDDARRLANLGGKPFRIGKRGSYNFAWAIVFNKKNQL